MDLELPTLSRRTLTQIMRRVLDLDTPTLLEISAEPLAFGIINPTTAGLYRIHGRAQEGRVTFPWTCLLKVIRAPAQRQAPDEWNYWEREALVYESPLLGMLPEGIRAPRVFGVERKAKRRAMIFMEEITGSAPPRSLADHVAMARVLGRMNGHFLDSRSPAVRAPWLSRDLLASTARSAAGSAELLTHPERWLTPQLRRLLPRTLPRRLQQVWEARESILKTLDTLPRTLCHFDAYAPNLFLSPKETVVIDWAFLGRGAVGMDLGQLIANTFAWLLLPPASLSRFLGQALSSYQRGLRDAGARVDARSITTAVRLSAALRTVLFAPFLLSVLTDRTQHGYWRQKYGGSVQSTVGAWGRAMDGLLALAED